MKKLLASVLLMAVLAVVCLAACTPASAPVYEKTDSGYTSGMNLKGISCQETEGGVRFALSFVSGSRQAGVPERAVTDVPNYETDMEALPGRIVVRLYGVEYADYTSPEWPNPVYGAFYTEESAAAPFVLYLQVANLTGFSVETDGSTLYIDASVSSEAESGYVVVLNAFDDAQARAAAMELGFSPSMSTERGQRIMVSDPLGSEAEAEQLLQSLDTSAIGREPYIQRVDGVTLPAYNPDADISGIEGKAILMTEGLPQTVPAAMQNGRFLCASPEGHELYAQVIIPEAGQDVEGVTTERIWLEGREDEILESFRFYDVKQAAFSADGRYLAILESMENAMMLYVYDTVTELLINVGEEGFGGFTCSFVWDDEQSVIYAMTGDTVFQLMQFDAASGEVSSVEEQQGAISDIALAGDFILFTDGAEVHRVSISDGTRSRLAEGFAVTPSPDGRRTAIRGTLAAGEDEEGHSTDVLIYDALTGSIETAAENVTAESICFIGERMYIAALAAEPQGDYIYELLCYEGGELRELGMLSTASMLAGAAGDLMLCEPAVVGSQEYMVTYRLDPDSL